MLETEIKKLHDAVKELTQVLQAQNTAQTFAPEPAVKESLTVDDVTPAEPTPVKDVSYQDLKDATLKASRGGHRKAVKDRLDSYGANKLEDLGGNTTEFYEWVISLEVNQ